MSAVQGSRDVLWNNRMELWYCLPGHRKLTKRVEWDVSGDKKNTTSLTFHSCPVIHNDWDLQLFVFDKDGKRPYYSPYYSYNTYATHVSGSNHICNLSISSCNIQWDLQMRRQTSMGRKSFCVTYHRIKSLNKQISIGYKKVQKQLGQYANLITSIHT